MKVLFALLIFLGGFSVHAGTCELVSGSFKTVSSACNYSHDGMAFYSDGYKEFRIHFDERSKFLSIAMTSDNYTLSYIADGKEQLGRPNFEGDKYVANCKNNHIHIRGLFSALINPMIMTFVVGTDGNMIYKQTFEGSNVVRVCELDRF